MLTDAQIKRLMGEHRASLLSYETRHDYDGTPYDHTGISDHALIKLIRAVDKESIPNDCSLVETHALKRAAELLRQHGFSLAATNLLAAVKVE